MIINKEGKVVASVAQPTVIFNSEAEYSAWKANLPSPLLESNFIVIKTYALAPGGVYEVANFNALLDLDVFHKVTETLYLVTSEDAIYRYDEENDNFVKVGGEAGSISTIDMADASTLPSEDFDFIDFFKDIDIVPYLNKKIMYQILNCPTINSRPVIMKYVDDMFESPDRGVWMLNGVGSPAICVPEGSVTIEEALMKAIKNNFDIATSVSYYPIGNPGDEYFHCIYTEIDWEDIFKSDEEVRLIETYLYNDLSSALSSYDISLAMADFIRKLDSLNKKVVVQSFGEQAHLTFDEAFGKILISNVSKDFELRFLYGGVVAGDYLGWVKTGKLKAGDAIVYTTLTNVHADNFATPKMRIYYGPKDAESEATPLPSWTIDNVKFIEFDITNDQNFIIKKDIGYYEALADFPVFPQRKILYYAENKKALYTMNDAAKFYEPNDDEDNKYYLCIASDISTLESRVTALEKVANDVIVYNDEDDLEEQLEDMNIDPATPDGKTQLEGMVFINRVSKKTQIAKIEADHSITLVDVGGGGDLSSLVTPMTWEEWLALDPSERPDAVYIINSPFDGYGYSYPDPVGP